MTAIGENRPARIDRKLSFTTTGLLAGPMPEGVNLEYATVNLVVTFQKAPTVENVAKVVEDLFYYHRMSTVPKGEERSTKWKYEYVGEIDPKKMIREVDISCNNREEWADIVQQQTKITLRRADLPWWEFVILNNRGKEDSLVLFRFDHCIGDGLSFAKVFTKMIKHMDGSEVESMIPKKMLDKKASINWGKMILGFPKALFDVATSPNGKADDPTCYSKNIVGPEVVSYLIAILFFDSFNHIWKISHQSYFLKVDNRHRKLVVFDTVPLDFIKAIKNAAEVSLNDVLLTTWSRAVHEYCTIQKCPVLKEKGEKLLYRILMPFGFPHKNNDPVSALRNTWSVVQLY